MEQNIILGGGTGGLVASHELKKKTKELARIMVIDKNDMHIYAPSFLWLMLGQRQAHKIQKPLSSLNRKGIEFINDEVVKIEPERKLVRTKNANFHYDYLIIALGAELATEKVPGLTEAGYDLYELEGVERLREDLKNFAGGKVAIIIASLPFKCPAAPYEAAFLLDEYFQKRKY
ncbi:sulfide:quinone oxidoreductase [Candidatus Hakubella thermalkaliphila]|uniref:Sulfide:quinone oxidoreductase n=1 Tax=Candidatus Hakubella thermalkaliphila TaxID=2754717 RepID=A0A6V8PKR7_9ACTN|nr:sulfide:quinone oxidoreductase [Candidatus Hakubella thermalkaliphila]